MIQRRMPRRVGIYCYNIAGNIHSEMTIPVKQRKRRHLPRRCAFASEHDSFQYLEALDDQSKPVINPIINQPIKTERGANERIVRRRLGIYSQTTFTKAHSESNEQSIPPNKRHLPRRCGIVRKHDSDQYSDESKAIFDPTDDKSYFFSKESDSNFTTVGTATIESGKNERFHVTEKIRRQYVNPSSLDVIIKGRLRDGNIGVTGYVEALYADQYKEAVKRSERIIIACAVLGSIEGRGGRCLKESTSKEGMYYEVDELYTMKKIKEALEKSSTIAKPRQ